jgi:DNA modification methylase
MPNWAKVYLGDSRAMTEVEDGGIDLAVTSPPYWHIKDYGVPGQIGYGQSLHEYLKDLYRAWRECRGDKRLGLDRNPPVAIVLLSNNH